MNYKVAFDILDAGYKAGFFAAFGLIFIFIGVVLVILRNQIAPKWPPVAAAIFAYFFLGFSVLLTTGAFLGTYTEYRSCRNALLNGTAKVTEGIVTNFVPMPTAGHENEKFTVNGITFSYSDYCVTSGFNNAKSHGGPIDEGKRVRVTYVDNVIVKLEIAENN